MYLRLLEFSFPDESIITMFRSRGPAQGVISIEVNPGFSFLLVQDLQSIVVDQDVCAAALHFICRDSSLDTPDRGHDDGFETFLVDRTLDRDVWQWSSRHSDGQHGRVESAVLLHLADRSKDLCKAADNDLSEELDFTLAGHQHLS